MRYEVSIIILPMHEQDIDEVSTIHAEQFSRQTQSHLWVRTNFAAYPRIMLFVARDEKDKVVGYIQWIHKSGFRKQAVIELEQMAILKCYQNQGIATKLILESFDALKSALEDNHCQLKTIIVSTRIDNPAIKIYKKTLGVQDVCIIEDLYSTDEVILMKNRL